MHTRPLPRLENPDIMAFMWDSSSTLSPDESWRQYVYRRRSEGASYNQLAEETGATYAACRMILRNDYRGDKPPGPHIHGLTADDSPLDPADLWARVLKIQAKSEEHWNKRNEQCIVFPEKAAGIAFLSDQHIGGGADYRAMRRDAETVRDSGLHAVLLGDFLNNWVVSKLQGQQRGEWLNHAESKCLYKDYINILRDKLVAVVSGNHDNWAEMVGEDYVRDSLKGIPCLYDREEVRVDLMVGGCTRKALLRHKWPGKSNHNVLYPFVRALKEGKAFDIGVGGHTHNAAVAGLFPFGERLVMGVQLASYKLADSYARASGFPEAVGSGAAAVILTEDGSMHGFTSLEEAARILDKMGG